MRENIKLILLDRMLGLTFLGCLFTLILQFAFVLFFYFRLPPLIPLLYQQPWGMKQILEKEFIFLLPFSALLFMVLNVTLALIMYQRVPLISRMFFWGSLFSIILSAISSVNIIFLVAL